MESTPSSSPLVVGVQQQIDQTNNKLTPEQEEEIKLRSKYPNPQKPGGSSFIQKMLHKGNKKYFDSGDYNMAKSRCKANGNKMIQTTTINNQHQVGDSSSSNSSLNDSPSLPYESNQSPNPTTPNIVNNNQSPIASTDYIQVNVNNCQVNSPLVNNTNIVNNNSVSTNNTSGQQQQQQYPTSPSVNYLNVNSYHSLSSSISASSLMTQSLSQDKLSNIHLNTSLSNVILDSEEIGHGIPTPECIQSRKHSIAQSKLATPRLSTS